jgi:RES domain-containing protein
MKPNSIYLWRLCKAKYAASALTGEGARLYAGRWNPAGVAMVYTSVSKSLACLELFVNLDPALLKDNYVEVAIDLPASLTVPSLDERDLPQDWRVPGNLATQQLGADWVRSGRSVALRVPSAVIDGEWNVLLNPVHADFQRLTPQEPKPFRFDPRMFRDN